MPAAAPEGPWRECFELAWDAFRAGTIPVGAVVADGAGEIVARGRNRIFEDTAPPGQLAGSYLAHAELNALAGLPMLGARDGRGPFDGHTLYTTLEPCALCVGAALMMMVGQVRFASADHYGGGRELRLENPHTARLPLVLSGPLDGRLGELGELLHVAFFLWRRPNGRVVAVHRERNTGLVQLAETLDLMSAAQAGASLDDAIELVEKAHARPSSG
jgi:tRNA(Arg) A34 adenosine deaminase TadA